MRPSFRFLVNVSPPKPLDVATSNFANALVRSKAGVCDGVPSTGLILFVLILNISINNFSFMSGHVFLG